MNWNFKGVRFDIIDEEFYFPPEIADQLNVTMNDLIEDAYDREYEWFVQKFPFSFKNGVHFVYKICFYQPINRDIVFMNSYRNVDQDKFHFEIVIIANLMRECEGGEIIVNKIGPIKDKHRAHFEEIDRSDIICQLEFIKTMFPPNLFVIPKGDELNDEKCE